MNDFVFDPPPVSSVPVHGGGAFPIRRIFCIGRNYTAHIQEMGNDPTKTTPIFFSKPADAISPCGASIPYPPSTNDLHYEGELVIALKSGSHGMETIADAKAIIYGHAAGCDLTRRDLQAAAKAAGTPWDAAKGFDQSAAVGNIGKIDDFPPEHLADARISTTVNGQQRQDAPLSDMLWTAPEIIIELSKLFDLKAGDLIFTGSPAGVQALNPGDRVEVSCGDLPALRFSIAS